MKDRLLKLLYPDKCMFCRRLLTKLEDEYICRLCYDRLKSEQAIQDFKQKKIDEIKIEGIDENGILSDQRPQKIIALLPYDNEYRQAILRWKYKGIRKYAKGFASLLAEREEIKALHAELLVPIPLAASRMRLRGFNQALDLANEMSKLMDIPVWDCLKRCKDTKPQAKCSKDEREKNVYRSMIFSKTIYKEVNSLILIDDIYTTGSTIKECIRVLRKEFPFRNTFIYVVVIGKGESSS